MSRITIEGLDDEKVVVETLEHTVFLTIVGEDATLGEKCIVDAVISKEDAKIIAQFINDNVGE